jgi:AbrB family looped-hinge helix DNA binding protein
LTAADWDFAGEREGKTARLENHEGEALPRLCGTNEPPWMPFANGFAHGRMPFMATRISIDKAGRVVLPKALREQMHVDAGDDLLVEAEGDRITLRPIRQEALLKKELGVWVYQGEASSRSIPELIEAEREKRVREFLE